MVYGTNEGHTKKIADRIGSWIEEAGGQAELFDSSSLDIEPNLEGFDAYILAGSLHQARHQAGLTEFARDHRVRLNAQPTAFLSVSLSAVNKDEKHTADCQKCIDAFLTETGLKPLRTTPVAGALLYTKYDFLTKQFMRMICLKEGGDTDTSRDFEYTDWEALKAFTEEFLALAAAASPTKMKAAVGR